MNFRLEYAETFEDVLRQKFLTGEDADIDYRAIDNDTSLDDHFAEAERRDAEDAYFDAE